MLALSTEVFGMSTKLLEGYVQLESSAREAYWKSIILESVTSLYFVMWEICLDVK